MTKKQYTREYIYDLECKERQLKAELEETTASPHAIARVNSTGQAVEGSSSVNASSIKSTTALDGYVGESSGLRYLLALPCPTSIVSDPYPAY